MMLLITGGSGSGKSAYGEERLLAFPGEKRIYLATMKPWDEECRKKIKRHQAMRAGKSFETVEQYSNIHKAAIPKHSAVLLECMSNLTANEMFGTEEMAEGSFPAGESEVVEKILSGVSFLKQQAENLVIITNEVFSDGASYDRETRSYLRALGRINCRLAAMADEAVEVVYGIPLYLKQGKKRE
ncbi:bifunctional adenosylcobinamide kinase/adenosylcobinamide-phosphate guanylyltransferase [Lachnospiraceae bacterium 62-35]